VRERYEMSTGKNYEAQLQRRNAARQKPVYEELKQLRQSAASIGLQTDNPVERGLELFRSIPGAEFHLFDKCAHWVQWDKAARFNDLVSNFLRS
jgi:pimeloyl-ACP methyl ester carboxylesterase